MAAPPACSIIKAMGLASYSSRSFPFLLLGLWSRGYIKIPPRDKILWTPATIEFYRAAVFLRSEEHTSELQSRGHLVCRLLLEKQTVGLPRDHPATHRDGT